MIERYFLEEIKKIWSEENYYEKYKEVEMALLKIRGEKRLYNKLKNVKITPKEIRKKEEVTNHEITAFLRILEEKIGKGSEKIHKGITSSDIMDTARMLQIKESIFLIEKSLKQLGFELKKKAIRYKNLVIAGRTHGQIAEPITLGLKFLRFYSSYKRKYKFLNYVKENSIFGKISGAVGTYSLISPEEEKKVLNSLSLKPLEVTSQIIPRDIFSFYVFLLSLISSLCEEIALEIRLLSQDGIKEISEPFSKKQTGSSIMPHKKNPVICERICGLSKIVRNYVSVSLENISLWNERDISHSSNERIMFEEISSLTYYILNKTIFVVKNLIVFEENIKINLEKSKPRIFSSGVLKLLLDKGLSREKAYRLVQKVFFKPQTTKQEIFDILNKEIRITKKELETVFDFRYYLRNIDKIYKKTGVKK